MNELEQIFTEMLNHIDTYKESYNKPEWTNEAIVKAWVKSHESKLKKLFISGVSKTLLAEEFNNGYISGCKDTEANYKANT